ncbi:hypothetical protein TEA_028944 [Camellia sinensis var. sinensis]|uniref:Uncharacterized protein n=1 Tax=Camellia sinensis var. sinensis TaxID=542762 RepID=A0A4S4EJ89_CAMSN|nr:hypothetical protein TEA_028944 [Camellia sinensis var. sinensis]
MSEVVKKAWNIYMLQLQLHPLRTKVITSGVLAGFQDLYSQKSSGIKKLQLRRLLLLMLYGFAYGGPFDYCCQKLTDFIFKGKNDIKTYAKKVLLQQLTYHPWNNLIYMVYYGLVVEVRVETRKQVARPPWPDNMKVKATSSSGTTIPKGLSNCNGGEVCFSGIGGTEHAAFLCLHLKNVFYWRFLSKTGQSAGRPWRSVKNKVRKEYPALQLDAWKVRVMFSTVYGSCWYTHLISFNL